VCSKVEGKEGFAIWVSDDNAAKIEFESNLMTQDMYDEIERLKAELHEYRSSGGVTGVVAAARRESQLASGLERLGVDVGLPSALEIATMPPTPAYDDLASGNSVAARVDSDQTLLVLKSQQVESENQRLKTMIRQHVDAEHPLQVELEKLNLELVDSRHVARSSSLTIPEPHAANNDMRLIRLLSQVRQLEEELRSIKSNGSSVSISASENVASAQRAQSQVIKADNLLKKTKYFRKYKSRFVQLDSSNGMLSWDGGTTYSGFVMLSRRSLVYADGEGTAEVFPFVVVHENKNIEFAASSEDERRAWIDVIADFVKAETTFYLSSSLLR
jgi:hypothetical protein